MPWKKIDKDHWMNEQRGITVAVIPNAPVPGNYQVPVEYHVVVYPQENLLRRFRNKKEAIDFAKRWMRRYQ